MKKVALFAALPIQTDQILPRPKVQTPPLPDMYGKNPTFKTSSADNCNSAKGLVLIEQDKIGTTHLISHRIRFQASKKPAAFSKTSWTKL